ncbi:MAG: hypothetical protein NXI32_18705 [bacterium]|nr:hypothetical protein [bacterium]
MSCTQIYETVSTDRRRTGTGASMRRLLSMAMQRADDLVIRMEYVDSKGKRTTRIVSPIRFLAKDRFLGLCLCRCEPRQFQLERCDQMELKSANEYVMPVPMAS